MGHWLRSYVVRHVGGYFERELDQAAYPAVAAPRGLVDQFALAALVDSVGVGRALVEELCYDAARAFAVGRV